MGRCTFSRKITCLRWIPLLLLIPYLALAIGAEGLHRFSYGPHHHNLVGTGSKPAPTIVTRPPLPVLKGNIHDADSCVLCQWLKYSPQGLPPKGISLVFTSREVSDSFPNAPSQILTLDKKFSRAPPRNFSTKRFPI